MKWADTCGRDARTTITLKGLCGGLVDQTIPLFKTVGMCGRDARTTKAFRGNGGAGVSPALCVALAVVLTLGCGAPESEIRQRLDDIPGATVTKRVSEDIFSQGFDIRLDQPLDHSNPSLGTFEQRILVDHRGFDKPVVLVTEGYTLGENRVAELAAMLGSNQIRVEHRFVGDSVPGEIEWHLLTLEQVSADYHRIRDLLREIYPEPWVSTGWSKGGQTALVYRSHFPDDVVATVTYSSPLPRSLEDPRIDQFFTFVGTEECRERLSVFQRAALENKAEILPLFTAYAQEKGHGLSVGEMRVLEYTVLEFPFSFWQYSDADCDDLPGADAPPQQLFEKLVDVVGISWFADSNLDSAPFHQFCTELGYYGFVTDHLEDLLAEADYPNCRWAPNWNPERYDPEPMRKLDEWVRSEAQRVMSIYGGVDPWSAPAIPVNEELDQRQYWDPKGNHFTVIGSLFEGDSESARQTLMRWVYGVPEEELDP